MLILTSTKSERCRESQKTIVTIEFTTLILCRVQNFIKIEAFAVLRPKLPKLLPNRWQVHTLTSVNIDRRQKLPKNYCHHWIHRPWFVQSMKILQNWRICHSLSKAMASKMTVPTLASVKNHKNYRHWWIQHLQIVQYAKFRGKWLTSFPIPCSPFPVPLFKDSPF